MAQHRHRSRKTPAGEAPPPRPSLPLPPPELAFTPRGDPDPRLVRLARLLGEQLARETSAAQERLKP
ncbi:hypothetical protein D2T33_21265 [Sinirhodobacter populi]|uniref:Uncharacterized protein n=1 Tax=Paenirhodobacter populi TaxID=2306993 RepID=A0A443IJ66_9RHOB|nr:hypothetical protein D2T33_21265 [Sinirhodobacter populi]